MTESHPTWPKGGEPLGEYEEIELHGHKVGFQAAGSGDELPKPPSENCCEAQPASCSAARKTSVAPSDVRSTDMDGLLDAQDAHPAHPPHCGQDGQATCRAVNGSSGARKRALRTESFLLT